MIFMIYKEEDTSLGQKLIGCLSLKIEESKIVDFKYKFEEISIRDKFPENWSWIGNSKFIETFDLEDSRIPFDIQKIIEENYIKEFSDKKEFLSKKEVPDYVLITKDIIINKIMKISSEEVTPIELSVSTSFILFKIISFFNEYPELTFDFPLYLEYIENESVDCSVEDFMINIINASNVLSS